VNRTPRRIDADGWFSPGTWNGTNGNRTPDRLDFPPRGYGPMKFVDLSGSTRHGVTHGLGAGSPAQLPKPLRGAVDVLPVSGATSTRARAPCGALHRGDCRRENIGSGGSWRDDGHRAVFVNCATLGKSWRRPFTRVGAMARIIENPAPRLVHDIDWGDNPALAGMFGPYRSLIAVPLFNEGLPLNWSLVIVAGAGLFHAGANWRNRLARGDVGRVRCWGGLRVSRGVGLGPTRTSTRRCGGWARIPGGALLPEPIPEIPGLRVAASYENLRAGRGAICTIFIPLGGRRRAVWCVFSGRCLGARGLRRRLVGGDGAGRRCTTFAAQSAGPADLFHTLKPPASARKRIEGSFVHRVPRVLRAGNAPAALTPRRGIRGPVLPRLRQPTDAFPRRGRGPAARRLTTRASFDETAIDLFPRPNRPALYRRHHRGPLAGTARCSALRGSSAALHGFDDGAPRRDRPTAPISGPAPSAEEGPTTTRPPVGDPTSTAGK